MKALLPLLALALTAPAASAQILGGNGDPDPAYATLYAWYDASDGVNGAGQPADGSSATSWSDRSVAGHSLPRVSSTVSRQPVFRAAGLNGMPALEFDGDDFIWGSNGAEFGVLSGGKTVFVVCEVGTGDLNSYVFDSSSGAGRNALLTGQNATPDTWQIYTGTGVAGGTVAVDKDTAQVHSLVIDAGAQEHFLDGSSIYTGAEGAQDLSGFLIGARYSTTNGFVGKVAEVLVYGEVLAAADRQAVEGYLAAKYGTGPSGPALAVSGLVAGGTVTATASGCTPSGRVFLGYSLAGAGPTSTPYGDVMLSPPYTRLTLTADANGDAVYSGAVPAGTSGLTVWLHALDLGSATFTNPLAEVIG
jgi:hypothetical protein